ncbi:hypothetical protein GPECTOR_11g90 [Gonium pectorale]|uniref:HTH La-type RNA-binding domain-containing protein n=1 Tax=Gonium pectorale TaxID=33097 RepID=A0A150GQE6_GONPE|nr:hypothetical protein GPECTOR_11g90 [Gonium pectorale]|eukprot:KXZ51968.1 hypothetical protein GPECTOR_11g90 [Gonium pectorale]
MAALDDATKAKVLRQVEFYFSDSNLPKDKFLKERMAEDPNGYVKLNIIIAFQRMRDLLKVTSSEPDQVPADVVSRVADVLAGSASLVLDESKTKLKRKTPLEDEAAIAKAIDSRSLYVRPFPVDTTVDAITEFFNGHAAVNCVRMRRHMKSKMFKGSVFVEFASEELAEKVLGSSLEYAGAPLRLQKKAAYLDSKREARKTRGAGKAHGGDHSDDSNIDVGLPDGLGGEVDSKAAAASPASAGRQQNRPQQSKPQQPQRGAKRKQDEPEYDEGDLGEGPSSKRSKPAEGAEQGAEAEGGDADEDMGEGEGEEVPEPTFVPGCLVDFTLDAELPELTGPLVIKDVMGGVDKILFVELRKDRKGGIIRFKTAELAATAIADFGAREEDARTIAGIKGSMSKVEGEAEKDFFKRVALAR